MKPPVITLLDYSVTQEHTSKPDREDEREEEGESFEARKQRFKEWQEGKSKGEAGFSFSFLFVKRKTNPLEQILVYSSFCYICPTSWLTVMQKYFQSSVIKICLKHWLLDPDVSNGRNWFLEKNIQRIFCPHQLWTNKRMNRWIDGTLNQGENWD